MLIEGKTKCENCDREFEWYYLRPERIGRVVASRLPIGQKSTASVARGAAYDTVLQLSARCQCCDFLNYFSYDSSISK